MVVNNDILGGLKSALSRGESLQRAMMTFYNAGYKKEEIEEAARALQQPDFKKVQPPEQAPAKSVQAPVKAVQSSSVPTQRPSQIVSDYGSARGKSKTIILILITLLVILLGFLIGIFVFREKYLNS